LFPEAAVRLTLQTDYALRTLMFLAIQPQRTTIGDVAQRFNISSAHVAKVVNQLARLRLVRSVRGVGGGIELAQPPDQIRIGQVVTAFEGSMKLLDCIDAEGVCVIESFCRLKSVLGEAERIQMEYLNSITLADVLPSNQQMVELRISAPDRN
jgi:Rrf2 family nitric oxide-sensitive transcriptional repressor